MLASTTSCFFITLGLYKLGEWTGLADSFILGQENIKKQTNSTPLGYFQLQGS